MKKLYLFLLLIFFIPVLVSAHQPRLVNTNEIVVTDPEVSKAYYGQLAGVPDVYIFTAEQPFALYVNILVPDVPGQKKDVSVTIIKDGNNQTPVATFDSFTANWERWFEKFGQSWYFKGLEYKNQAEPGNYKITVWSENNDSKYALAIGEQEKFNFPETVNALHLVPQLKRNFFEESPITFILSPLGWGYILAMYLLAALFGWLLRFFLNKKACPLHNIDLKERLLRVVFGLLLLLWAVTSAWNPLLLFLSGFCLFEAIFSWCGIVAIIKMK